MDDSNPYHSPSETQNGGGSAANTLGSGEQRILKNAVRSSKERWLDMGIVVPAIFLVGITAYHYYRGYNHTVAAGTTIGEVIHDDAGGFRGDSFDGEYVRAIDKFMTGTMVLFVSIAMFWFAFYARKRALLTARLYMLLREKNLIPSIDAADELASKQLPARSANKALHTEPRDRAV